MKLWAMAESSSPRRTERGFMRQPRVDAIACGGAFCCQRGGLRGSGAAPNRRPAGYMVGAAGKLWLPRGMRALVVKRRVAREEAQGEAPVVAQLTARAGFDERCPASSSHQRVPTDWLYAGDRLCAKEVERVFAGGRVAGESASGCRLAAGVEVKGGGEQCAGDERSVGRARVDRARTPAAGVYQREAGRRLPPARAALRTVSRVVAVQACDRQQAAA